MILYVIAEIRKIIMNNHMEDSWKIGKGPDFIRKQCRKIEQGRRREFFKMGAGGGVVLDFAHTQNLFILMSSLTLFRKCTIQNGILKKRSFFLFLSLT